MLPERSKARIGATFWYSGSLCHYCFIVSFTVLFSVVSSVSLVSLTCRVQNFPHMQLSSVYVASDLVLILTCFNQWCITGPFGPAFALESNFSCMPQHIFVKPIRVCKILAPRGDLHCIQKRKTKKTTYRVYSISSRIICILALKNCREWIRGVEDSISVNIRCLWLLEA